MSTTRDSDAVLIVGVSGGDLQAFAQARRVGELCQRIVSRPVRKDQLRFVMVGDVEHGPDDEIRAHVGQPAHLGVHPTHLAAGVHDPVRGVPIAQTAGCIGDDLADDVPVVWVHELVISGAGCLAWDDAEHR
jgi:hypothetical protein